MIEGNVSTPFVEKQSFLGQESELATRERSNATLGSPFVSVYELEGQEAFVDPEQAAFSTLAQELYDSEFDEALFELMADTRALHDEHSSSAGQLEGERVLNQHFNQLVREAEATVDAFAREFGTRDVQSLEAEELEAFADRYAPSSGVNPEFERFLGKWAKKIARGVTRVARKAGKFALKLGLGPILNRLVALVKPLLRKVLQSAIGKLPEELRPAAQQLADRFAGRSPSAAPLPSAADGAAPVASAPAEPAPSDASAAVQEPAGPSTTELQQEFDRQVARVFTASDEVELELEVARANGDAKRPSVPVYPDLDRAREQLIDGLQNLKEGEDPAPHIQNFLPAVLPALKLGIQVAGRTRVRDFLAGFLAKMIAKLVSPATAPALSKAIVDAGMRLLSLETSREDEARAGATAVAATVEETVRRVSALPEYVLDSKELLEGFALEAFEQAAAANLPPVLSESVYRERPELLEMHGAKSCWVMLPLRRRKRYKKCGRTFKVRITPFTADEIDSFEGPLSDYLQDQLGLEEGAEVEAEMELYETLPGTTLPDIAREESEAAGAQQGSAPNAAGLHPLTPQAAGLLLGQPRLGRRLPWGTHARRIGVGQRLYRLTIPGRRQLFAVGRGGKSVLRKSGGVRLSLDFSKAEIRVCILLSEVKAQRLAVRLRRQSHPGAISAGFRKYLARRLPPIVHGDRPLRVRLVHSSLPSTEALGAALKRLPPGVAQVLAHKLEEYLVEAFAEFVKTQSQRFIAAAEDTADGVTLSFTMARPAGLELLGKALVPAGPSAGVAEALKAGAKPEVVVDVIPGHKCD